MKLTILGSSGSLGAPDNAASGYLIQVDNAPGILMDMGPGVLAQLEGVQNPSDAHVVFRTCMLTIALIFLLFWCGVATTRRRKRRGAICALAPQIPPSEWGV